MTTGLVIVGAGKWGRNHVSTAKSLVNPFLGGCYGRGLLLQAVVDADSNALENVSRELQLGDVKSYTSLTKALAQHPDAAVVIATPPVTHYKLAKEALLSDRHVLIEKPFCTNFRHAAELVQLAEKKNRVLMINHLLQYSIDHRRLINLVRSGFVGDVTRIRMSRLNFGTVRLEENVLWSFSPHDISILLSLCKGKLPSSLSCAGQSVVSKGIEDYIDLAMEFDDGVTARIEASWMHPLKERRTIVYGTEGSIVLNEATPNSLASLGSKLQGFKWSARGSSDGSGVTIEKSEKDATDIIESADEAMRSNGELVGGNGLFSQKPLQFVQEHFLECIKSGTTPRTDGSEALRVMKILTAASESLTKGGASINMGTWTPTGADLAPKPASPAQPSAVSNSGATRGLAEADSSSKQAYFAHPSAVVDSGAIIGAGSKIWHFSHVMPGARLGEKCNIGQNVYIGGKAVLGRNVKVQNNVSIYDRVEIEDDVFLGPSCVFTNVKTPRSHISRKDEYSPTLVKKGATIGANATIVCGLTLGSYCLIGAGAVVTKDVQAYSMVYGNPAKPHGWVSRTGATLKEVSAYRLDLGVELKDMVCTESGEGYWLHQLRSAHGPPISSVARKEESTLAGKDVMDKLLRQKEKHQKS